MKKIAIGCDHGGFAYKDAIIRLLESQNISVTDFGTFSGDSVDYPDHIHPVAQAVEGEQATLGIILCGSGNGAAMTANKYKGIRAALCWTAELAALARQHNNANVLSIPARFVEETLALDMVTTFINTDYEGGRHQRRLDKMVSFC